MIFSKAVLRGLADNPAAVLNRGYRAKERIAARQARLKDWRQVRDDAAELSGNLQSCVNIGQAIAKLENSILDEIAILADYEIEASKIIQKYVAEPNHKAVLEHRYLEYKSWEVIAVEMGYTFRWTQALHCRALQALKTAAAAELKRKRVNS